MYYDEINRNRTEQIRSKQNTTSTTMRTIETEQIRSKQNTTCTTMRAIETEQTI